MTDAELEAALDAELREERTDGPISRLVLLRTEEQIAKRIARRQRERKPRVRIERWSAPKHIELLGSWIRGWRIAPHAGPEEFYPPNTLIADGVVLASLFVFEGVPVGHIGGIVSDPRASKKRRRAALDLLLDALLDEADRLRLRRLTSYPTTAIRNLELAIRRKGFKVEFGNGHLLYRCQ